MVGPVSVSLEVWVGSGGVRLLFLLLLLCLLLALLVRFELGRDRGGCISESPLDEEESEPEEEELVAVEEAQPFTVSRALAMGPATSRRPRGISWR